MVVDCFTFFNEVSLAYLRMTELDSIVDFFVIVESAKTFSGKDKPLVFKEYEDLFKKWSDRIIYLPLMNLPPLVNDTEENRFWLEGYQRNQIFMGLSMIENINFDDLILIGDADEIPTIEAIIKSRDMLKKCEAVGFKQDAYNYSFENLIYDNSWVGTCAVSYGLFSKTRPHEIRTDVRMNRTLDVEYIDNAGWHLSYFGGREVVSFKEACFSHGAPDVKPNQESLDFDFFPVSLLCDKKIDDKSLNIVIDFIRLSGHKLPNTVLLSLGKFANYFNITN